MTEHPSAEVLVVDDEAALAESYAAIIGTKHEVRTATGGSEALDVVDSDVDVVLLDRRMPDISGLEVLEELRDRELGCQIIICSAVDPDLEILDHDFDTYLRKPVGSDELLESIDRQHRLSGCDEQTREYCALEARRATIEDARPVSSLEGSDRYEQLLAELERSSPAHASDGGRIHAY